MNYVLVCRNTKFWLVGAFRTSAEALSWASDPANNPSQDPRWQVVTIPRESDAHVVAIANARLAITAEIVGPDLPMAGEPTLVERAAA